MIETPHARLLPSGEERPKGGLRAWCKFLGWQYLAGAVLDVYAENIMNEEEDWRKGSADAWSWSTPLRQELLRRTREKWCERSELDPTWFPYSQDAVVKMWLRFRKRSPAEVAEFRREIEAACAGSLP